MTTTNPLQAITESLAKNDLYDALSKAETLVTQNTQDSQAQHLLAIVYARANLLEKAKATFSIAIQLDPKQPEFHNNYSNLLKQLGELELAKIHLREAIRLKPNYAQAYNNLASLFYREGKLLVAIENFEKAIRLDPKYWEPHYNLANACYQLNRLDQAIEHYCVTLQFKPDLLDAQQNLAMCYIAQDDFVSALPLLEKVVPHYAKHVEMNWHLAETYLSLGKTEKAITQFEKTVALAPDNAELTHNLAVLYLKAELRDKALTCFQQTLKLAPDNDTAKHMVLALTGQASESAPANYVASLFDQYAPYYDKHMQQTLDYQVPALLRQAISNQLDTKASAKWILDLGCGTGLCAPQFRDLAHFLVGVDISPAMLAVAHNLKGYDALCRADIKQWLPGLSKSVFDIIIAADVFVYFGDLQKIFSNCAAVLKNKGLLTFTIESTLESNYKLQLTGRYAHAKEYILALAAEYGFSILQKMPIDLRKNRDQVITGNLFVLQLNNF